MNLCPFCGNNDLSTGSAGEERYIVCRACGATGPWAGSAEEARELWDKRNTTAYGQRENTMGITEAKNKLKWALSIIKLIEEGELGEAREAVAPELNADDPDHLEEIIDIYGNLLSSGDTPGCITGALHGLLYIVNECREVLFPEEQAE